MKNKKSKSFIMKWKLTTFVLSALCIATLTLGISGVNKVNGKADRILQESNTSYVMSAVSDENSVGVAVTYVKATDDTQMEFDLLKNVENGYFGVAFGEESSLSSLACNYVAFSSTGSAFLSQGMPTPSIAFKSGYRYRVEWNKKNATARILRKPYAAYETLSYELIYTATISKTVDSIGVFTRSQGENSASACIDNFYAKFSDGTVVEESFDKRVGNVKATYSNQSSYGILSAGARYTVVFTDLNGNTLKIVDTSEYGYAMCEGPVVEGKTFVGWNISPKCVTENMILYPIYRDGESTGNKNDQTGESGCNSSLTVVGVVALASLATFVGLTKKKGA